MSYLAFLNYNNRFAVQTTTACYKLHSAPPTSSEQFSRITCDAVSQASSPKNSHQIKYNSQLVGCDHFLSRHPTLCSAPPGATGPHWLLGGPLGSPLGQPSLLLRDGPDIFIQAVSTCSGAFQGPGAFPSRGPRRAVKEAQGNRSGWFVRFCLSWKNKVATWSEQTLWW